jgi:hypothetical protein
VALVITLILLAVITTLAIAFLALTYRETAAVDSLARTTDSEQAGDSALERAKAEILAPFGRNNTNRFSWATNGIETMGPDFMVSVAWNTNWLNPQGMATNPSPPVFVSTNRTSAPPGPFENRFYLDLNRNGHFEETGFVEDTDDSFRTIPNQFNWRVGDPQWIGVLQDPRRPHTNDNRFIYRYAYLIQPIGRSLDANWIHNEAIARGSGSPGFHREQGIGSWEINLAAFLADLNTNRWFYDFVPNADPSVQAGVGSALYDAREFLLPRFLGNRANMDWAANLFPGGGLGLTTDQIDIYANGFNAGPNPDLNDNPNAPWPGSNSKRHYFSPHELFDTNKLPSLTLAWKGIVPPRLGGNSYDRYTYYRMLAQLGTDSAEEEEGKININFMNIRSWANPDIRLLASDLVPWSTNSAVVQVPRLGGAVNMGRVGPELFFLSVVTNLFLREPNLAFIVTNPPGPLGLLDTPLRIPIFTNRAFGGLRSTITTNLPLPGPLYAGRIHQILQQAANIFDATTGSKQGEAYPYFPSIFRPRFQTANNGDVYIIDYSLVPESETYAAFRSNTDTLWRDLDSGDVVTTTNDLVYGIPLILGARKGFPNFNEVAVLTAATATRKLTVFRSQSNRPPDKIEQDMTMQVRTKIQVEARNPWATYSYSRPLRMDVGFRVGLQVTNSSVRFPPRDWLVGTNYVYPANRWPGEPPELGTEQTNSYVLTPVFETMVLDWHTNTLVDLGNVTNFWSVTLTNRMLFFIVDNSVPNGRIVDFVTLNRPHNHFEIGKLMEEDLPSTGSQQLDKIWSSARANNMSLGNANQLAISQNAALVGDRIWGNYDRLTAPSKEAAATHFLEFMRDEQVGTNQAPFTPTRIMVQANYYQVGDPLVHYTFEDLRDDPDPDLKLNGTESPGYNFVARTNLSSKSLGLSRDNALTWNRGDIGVSDSTSSTPGAGLLDPTVRDPGLIYPDKWDFPTNLFPNIGWLGRVHRSTPWQTIYLKSRPPNQDWQKHSGNQRHPNSAALMVPMRDWELLDIFTSAPHANATRGRLSINQTNLAAWSAVLAGAVTTEPIPHPDDASFTAPQDVAMQPAAISPAIETIVAGINQQRTNISSQRYSFGGQPYPFAPFNKLSDLLSTPELTDASPFLNVDPNRFDAYKPNGAALITDVDYERIPQQILSLVKLGEPRFVVYAWGQSLKPARRNPEDTGPSIVTTGADRGLCRNYQITGEVATRAVIRVEFDRITDPFHPQFNQPDYSRPRAVVESFNILPVE